MRSPLPPSPAADRRGRRGAGERAVADPAPETRPPRQQPRPASEKDSIWCAVAHVRLEDAGLPVAVAFDGDAGSALFAVKPRLGPRPLPDGESSLKPDFTFGDRAKSARRTGTLGNFETWPPSPHPRQPRPSLASFLIGPVGPGGGAVVGGGARRAAGASKGAPTREHRSAVAVLGGPRCRALTLYRGWWERASTAPTTAEFDSPAGASHFFYPLR